MSTTPRQPADHRLLLECGCIVHVVCDVTSGLALRRVIETAGQDCRQRAHKDGVRLFLWDILPQRKPDRGPTAASDAIQWF